MWSSHSRAAGYLSSIHMADAASAVVAAIEVPAGVYNVADDQPLTRREYADALAVAAGATPWVQGPGRLARIFGERLTSLTRSVRPAIIASRPPAPGHRGTPAPQKGGSPPPRRFRYRGCRPRHQLERAGIASGGSRRLRPPVHAGPASGHARQAASQISAPRRPKAASRRSPLAALRSPRRGRARRG
jgi:hypothetical protein